jgi:hypothetical protein
LLLYHQLAQMEIGRIIRSTLIMLGATVVENTSASCVRTIDCGAQKIAG